MGLFDNIAGKVIGKMGGGENQDMLQVAIKLFNEYGGLSGIVEKLRASGFAAEVDSWVGTGNNLPISPAQIEQVFGAGTLDDIAAKLNLPAAEISRKLAEYLPKAIDRLTPDGTIPKNQSAVLLQALSMFKS